MSVRKLFFTWLAACLLLSSFARAADPNDLSDVELPAWHSVITNLPEDMSIWLKETFSQDNLPTLLGVIGMTGIATMTDFETWQAFDSHYKESENFKSFSDLGEEFSNGEGEIILAAGFLAAGTLTTNHRAWRTLEQIGEAYLASGIVTQVIKRTTGRESPDSSGQRTGHWSVFPNWHNYNHDVQGHDAMPSGHLSTAMSAFIVVQENYPEQTWIPWVGYPVMGWICVGVVAKGIHWVSDLPIAFALGYHFSKIVTRNNYPDKDKGYGTSLWNPDILPTFTEAGEPVVAARWKF